MNYADYILYTSTLYIYKEEVVSVLFLIHFHTFAPTSFNFGMVAEDHPGKVTDIWKTQTLYFKQPYKLETLKDLTTIIIIIIA